MADRLAKIELELQKYELAQQKVAEAEEAAKRQELEEAGEYKKLWEESQRALEDQARQLEEERLAAIRARIGAKYGLSEVFYTALQGTTEEEIEQHAINMEKLFPKAPAVADGAAGSAPQPTTRTPTMSDRINQKLNTSRGVYDPL